MSKLGYDSIAYDLKCKLENNKIINYDEAISFQFSEKYPLLLVAKMNSSRFKYLGRGVICSIDGIIQKSENQCHFFQYQ